MINSIINHVSTTSSELSSKFLKFRSWRAFSILISFLLIMNFGMLTIFCKIEKSNGRRVPNLDVLRKHLLREGHLDKP